MPDSGRFFDANVLLYLASDDEAKARISEQLLREGGTVSVQVLNEIANVSRRKMRKTWAQTHELLTALRSLLTIVPVTETIHESGLKLAERYMFSVYDGMIVAAALEAGCDSVMSEDMQDGLVVDERLVIVDPFRDL